MKLSEAIREGSKMHPQSDSGWNDRGPDGQVRTCTLMAAALAAGLYEWYDGQFIYGIHATEGDYSEDKRTGERPSKSVMAPAEWMVVTLALELPPCACARFGIKDEVMPIIWHLNDVHHWSREAVAEWIEIVENVIEARIASNNRKALAKLDDHLAEARKTLKQPAPEHVSSER